MQSIILAAGLSKRLRPLTDSVPKCLLKIGAKTILEMTIGNILLNRINEFIIVTGYREEMIKDFVSGNFPDLNVKFLSNTGFENNNNSYSLWLTKDHIKRECILLDSDIVFDRRIISALLSSGHENCLAVNTKHRLGDEEIKVIIDTANKIQHIGKEPDPHKSFGESIGIERFSHGFFKELGEILDRKITKEGNVNEFYETSFQELIDCGNEIYAVDVSGYESIEIDTPDDLERAEKISTGLADK